MAGHLLEQLKFGGGDPELDVAHEDTPMNGVHAQERSINRPLLPPRLVQALRAARNTGQLRRRETTDVDFPTPLQLRDVDFASLQA
ncbi:MAG TPA: hypothetical protein VF395_15290 [Polyangiaceae bacterium]